MHLEQYTLSWKTPFCTDTPGFKIIMVRSSLLSVRLIILTSFAGEAAVSLEELILFFSSFGGAIIVDSTLNNQQSIGQLDLTLDFSTF